MKKMYLILRRIVDIIVAIIGLIITAPLFCIIAIAIKCESKGTVFFKQKRYGKNKRFFYIYKFRTMKSDTPKDVPTHLLNSPEIYITKVGKFLRKTSLDEIPQLINILKGEMTLIGPRPALYNQDDLMAERDKYGANSITPGLTGWAQVNGRDELTIDVKAKYDGEYCEKISLLLDIKIVFLTILKVIKQEGTI